jgi:hypothetical protein
MSFATSLIFDLSIVGAGIVSLLHGRSLRRAMGVLGAPVRCTGEAARLPNGSEVSVDGLVACTEPLVAPLSRRQCLTYRHRVEEITRSGENEFVRVVYAVARSATFALDDGSGPVEVRLASDAELYSDEHEAFRQEVPALRYGQPCTELTFGSVTVPLKDPTPERDAIYVMTERILSALHQRLFVCGQIADGRIEVPSVNAKLSMIATTLSRMQVFRRQRRIAAFFVALGVLLILAAVVLPFTV